MAILDEILEKKEKEVAERKAIAPVKRLEKSIYFDTRPVSLVQYLRRPDKSGIIAEFKRRSPSAGDIHPHADIEKVSVGYMQAGASALSVLTDETHFGGSNDDLRAARKLNYCPILRKDFIVDPYQVTEAKSIGADAILLIAELLDRDAVEELTQKAHELKMEVLLEVHDEVGSEWVPEKVDLIGVNNRDLRTFQEDKNRAHQLIGKLPGDKPKVAESAIQSAADIMELQRAGFEGFLVGGSFMRESRPERACRELIEKIGELERPQEANTQ